MMSAPSTATSAGARGASPLTAASPGAITFDIGFMEPDQVGG